MQMVKIYTTCRNIQELDFQILEGIVKNSCSLKCVNVNKGESKRERFTYNWNEAFKQFEENIFIGMDSDVKLNDDSIKVLLEGLRDYDLVYMSSHESNTLKHALWAVKKEIIEKVPLIFKDAEHCPVCWWIRNSIPKAGYRISCIRNHILKEV